MAAGRSPQPNPHYTVQFVIRRAGKEEIAHAFEVVVRLTQVGKLRRKAWYGQGPCNITTGWVKALVRWTADPAVQAGIRRGFKDYVNQGYVVTVTDQLAEGSTAPGS